MVAKQLSQHHLDNNLYELFQSAYKTCHSTEAVLSRVSNDTLQALHAQQAVCYSRPLRYAGMSATFDTSDHTILLAMLEERYGIERIAHQWFRPYLSDRSQRVRILEMSWSLQTLNLGLPQGSVLGPLIFTLYSATVASIARSHGLEASSAIYVDDTQLYTSSWSSEVVINVARVECCLAEIKVWLLAHKLKFNDPKTVMMDIRRPRSFSALSDIGIMVSEGRIVVSEATRNLGVILNQYVNMQNHFQKVCRASYAELRNIAQVRSVLPQSVAVTMQGARAHHQQSRLL